MRIGLLIAILALFIGCKNEELRVATAASFAPFEYIEGGQFKGIDIDIVENIAKELNLKLVINDMEFDSVVQAVASNNADIGISGLTVNNTRKQVIDFSEPYFSASQMVLVRDNDSRFAGKFDKDSLINKIKSIKGLKIGTQVGTTGEFYVEGDKDWGFEGFHNVNSVSFTNGAMAVTAMLNNQIDAVIIDEMPARILQKSNKGVKLIDIPLTDEKYAIGVSKGNKELLDKINKILENMKADGRLNAIIAKYYK